MINIWRVIRNSWKNFYRNLWLSVATLFMMFTALAIVGGLFLFDASLNTFIAGLQDKVDVSVYFKEEAPEKDILAVKNQIEKRDEVKEIKYISQSEALEIFKARHSENEILLESLKELDTNPLQASINIKVYDPSMFIDIVEFIENSSSANLVDSINFRENEKVINSISQISDSIKKAGFLFTIVLGVLVIFVTFNTIRLAIYTARDEIYIMKLVGGSNWFVRTPFVITGALYGAVAGVLVLGAFFGTTKFARAKFSLIFADIDLYGHLIQNIWTFILLVLGSGILIGMISSWMAVRRYLHI